MPPLTVERLVMYEVIVSPAPAGVHEGQDGDSVLVTTLVITLGGELEHDAGGPVGHVPGEVMVTPGPVTVTGLQVVRGSVTVTALLSQVSGEHDPEIVSVETTVPGLPV